MWKTRLLIIMLAAASAWGWARASMTEPAVRRAQQREARWSLTRSQQAFSALLRLAQGDLARRVRSAADDPALTPARESPEAAQLFVRRLPKDGTDEDWILLSKDGIVIARSGNAAKRGASLLGEPGVGELLTGMPLSGLTRFEETWRIVAGVPIRGSLGLEGALLCLRRLDGELAHELATGSGAEIAFVDGDRVLGTLPSSALADMRQRPWEGAAPGAIDDVDAGGNRWHVIQAGISELEVLLLRPHAVGADPLGELGLRSSDAWLQPRAVGAAFLFGLLALFGVLVAGREGSAAPQYYVQSIPETLPRSAFVDDPDEGDEPQALLLEEALLGEDWSDPLDVAVESAVVRSEVAEARVDSVTDMASAAATVAAGPPASPDPEDVSGTAATDGGAGEAPPNEEDDEAADDAEGFDPPWAPEPDVAEQPGAARSGRGLGDAAEQPSPAEPAVAEGNRRLSESGGATESAAARPEGLKQALERRQRTPHWDTPVADEPGSVTVEWSGRYDTPDPLAEALKTPAPEPLPDESQRKYEALYVHFLQSRQACGESTEDISYERFERRLDRNARKVRERYDCDDVRFNIRVVSGRAKIKAIPVTDGATVFHSA